MTMKKRFFCFNHDYYPKVGIEFILVNQASHWCCLVDVPAWCWGLIYTHIRFKPVIDNFWSNKLKNNKVLFTMFAIIFTYKHR
jgi:hypothetical protein